MLVVVVLIVMEVIESLSLVKERGESLQIDIVFVEEIHPLEHDPHEPVLLKSVVVQDVELPAIDNSVIFLGHEIRELGQHCLRSLLQSRVRVLLQDLVEEEVVEAPLPIELIKGSASFLLGLSLRFPTELRGIGYPSSSYLFSSS